MSPSECLPSFLPPPPSLCLKHQLRANVSSGGLPGDFREVLQLRLGELEKQLLRKVAELEDEKSLLHNETSAHRQKTESALNALLQRVAELERGTCGGVTSVSIWQGPGAPHSGWGVGRPKMSVL